ncbi:LOB domain-containing protein 22-like [Actinidia eriantha]|uniref:LOB domain-containing protein 22-like n=1 Tax=Actinidia eriantha TaxID=165200 RepID=UPI00258BB974|nr:LOB domain-containing protein 22-like [Actinidia eriantha]
MSNNTMPNGVPHACAACKYQRRKCAPDCILAPYFPHDRQRQFLNAHKLFGVSNITKILKKLDPHKKDAAMRTIVFQSDVRASDPVGGCYRIIRELHRQIEYSVVELQLVLQQIAMCRAQIDQQSQIPLFDLSSLSCADSSINHNPLGMCEEEYFLHENNHVVPFQDVASWAMQDTTSSSLHDKEKFANEGGDFKQTILHMDGERLEFKFDCEEETIQQSGAISKEDGAKLKEEIASFISEEDKAVIKEEIATIEDAQTRDLKNAATHFSRS